MIVIANIIVNSILKGTETLNQITNKKALIVDLYSCNAHRLATLYIANRLLQMLKQKHG